jgi:hypothetical protein
VVPRAIAIVALAAVKLPAETDRDRFPDVRPVQVDEPEPDVLPQDPPEILIEAPDTAAESKEFKTVTVRVEEVGCKYRWTVSEPLLSIVTFPYVVSCPLNEALRFRDPVATPVAVQYPKAVIALHKAEPSARVTDTPFNGLPVDAL